MKIRSTAIFEVYACDHINVICDIVFNFASEVKIIATLFSCYKRIVKATIPRIVLDQDRATLVKSITNIRQNFQTST